MYSEVYSFKETLKKWDDLGSLDVVGYDIENLVGTSYGVFGQLTDKQLELLANKSRDITRQRFGNTIRLFVPLYLSNECYNSCTYCGFSYERKIDRYTLSKQEVLDNIDILVEKGFQHILLLTGESSKRVETIYFKEVLELIRPKVSQLGIEVQPLDVDEYKQLIDKGLDQVTVYQETYHKDRYLMHHLSGKKRRFDYRLNTSDRAALAGIYKVNIGALFGLSDWRFEAIALVDHLSYLIKTYWKTHFSISFPRITSIFDSTKHLELVADRDLVQLICGFRCLFPDCGITLSTRESEKLRNGLLTLGITDMSAESLTSPGAYSGVQSEPQFSTTDHRLLDDVCDAIKFQGLDPVMKDWDYEFSVKK